MFRGAIFAGAFAAFAAPALAQCPQAAVQDSVNIWMDASGVSDLAVVGAKVDALGKACPDDAYVQKVLAIVDATLSQRITDPAAALGRAASARARAMIARDRQPPNELPVTAMAGNQPIAIRMFGDNFDEEILANLLAVEARTGLLSPDSQPLKPGGKPGEKPRACRDWDSVDAQTIARIARKTPKADATAPLAQIDRIVAACSATMASGLNETILAARIKTLFDLLTANPSRPGAQAMLERAVADSARFFELRPNGDTAYWSTYDRDRLAKLAEQVRVAAMPDVAEADWFKAGNTESPKVVRAIASRLDDAWAIDEPRWTAGKFQTYRDLIRDLQGRTYTAPDVKAARRALALAAQGHANGSFRKPENARLRTPPDWLWTYIDPDVKPTP